MRSVCKVESSGRMTPFCRLTKPVHWQQIGIEYCGYQYLNSFLHDVDACEGGTELEQVSPS